MKKIIKEKNLEKAVGGFTPMQVVQLGQATKALVKSGVIQPGGNPDVAHAYLNYILDISPTTDINNGWTTTVTPTPAAAGFTPATMEFGSFYWDGSHV